MGEIAKAMFGDEPALEAGETVLKKGPANLFRGIESVGGRLFLTEKRLIFQSHKINVQAGEESWPLTSITDVRPAMTMFIVPNGLLMWLADGTRRRFVVWGRKEWAREIGARIPLPKA